MVIESHAAHTAPTGAYLLANDEAEVERLRLQALAWEPAAETMLDLVGVQPGWNAVDVAFAQSGGDFNAGRRTYGMLRRAGLEDVRVRVAAIALQDGHPYMRLPIQLATALRQRILERGLLNEAELDEAIAVCEQIVQDPDTFVISFAVTQVWGRKPACKKEDT